MSEQISLSPVERHPFEPFLPENAKILMLGSFPPQEKRWAMSFYYPNFINDMWRIVGTCFFEDKDYFINLPEKNFKEERLKSFLHEKGIALFDTAVAVRRLSGNASDKDLEVVEPTDIHALLERIPLCASIVTTGQKATDTICACFDIKAPKLGTSVSFTTATGREMRLYRMPSSSRAYPMKLEKKAVYYRQLFTETGLL